MDKNICVYFHINLKTNEVFYVGIGLPDRPFSKKKRNLFWKRIVAKYGYKIEIVHENLSWEEACKLEMKYIKEIGRKDLGLGTLTNLTDGGDGSLGIIQSTKTKSKREKTLFNKNSKWRKSVTSDEFKNKMRDVTFLGTEEHKKLLSEKFKGAGNPMYGKKITEVHKKAISDASKKKAGKKWSELYSEDGIKRLRAGISNRGKNSKKRNDCIVFELTSPDGRIFYISGAVKLQEFCKENKLQYHTLKNNVGKQINETDVKGTKTFAKNTIGWKIQKKI